MKSVLISIQPKWCALIANGEKTIEVRKTRPKLKTPFKCYIYCTKQNGNFVARAYGSKIWLGMGKVIGEFVCDLIGECTIDRIEPIVDETPRIHLNPKDGTGLTLDELVAYVGVGKPFYDWYISDLKIFDKPKELGEFRYPYDYDGEGFIKCNYDICPHVDYKGHWKYDCVKECPDLRKQYEITRPPQSWCYVEER